MRYIKAIIATIIVCIVFSACSTADSGQAEYFGFKINAFTVIDEKDTHGGFHGDGSYHLILDCSPKKEEAMELIKDWTPLPLTENLQLIMYGGVKNGAGHGYHLAGVANWPVINNGVYKFVDRHPEAVDKSDDTNLFNRYSYNFSVAVYDLDTNTLYYFELDT